MAFSLAPVKAIERRGPLLIVGMVLIHEFPHGSTCCRILLNQGIKFPFPEKDHEHHVLDLHFHLFFVKFLFKHSIIRSFDINLNSRLLLKNQVILDCWIFHCFPHQDYLSHSSPA